MANRISLADKVRGREKEEKNSSKPKNATVNQITTSLDSEKDKQISAKVNTNTYALFTQINKAQGLSNNSAINMLIARYVRENKALLNTFD